MSNNNSNDAPPTTPTTESLLGALNEKDRLIYERNNIRLRQMEAEVRQLATYGGACDELLEWLKDPRAYNPYNEKALLGCISAIFEKASEYGPWSGLEILKEANQRCGKGLSEKGRACVRKCYEDLHNSVTGRRPSNASVVSTASASHPSPASLTSTRSISHANIPGSPTTNQLVKLFDASVFPQSPNSNMGSPMSSPQFRGIDVSASQIASNQQPAANNLPLNNNHLNAYLQQRLAQAQQLQQQSQQSQQSQQAQQAQQAQQLQQQAQQLQQQAQQQQAQQAYQYPYQYQTVQTHQPLQAQHIPLIHQQHLTPAQFQQMQQLYHDQQLRKAQFEEQQRRAQEQQQQQQQRRVQEEQQGRALEEEQRREQNRLARAQEVQRQKAQFEHQAQQQMLLKQQQAQKQQLQHQKLKDDEQRALARHYLQVLAQSAMPAVSNTMSQSVSMPAVAAHLQSSLSMAAALNSHGVTVQQQQQQQAQPVHTYPASLAVTSSSTLAPVVTTSAATPVVLNASAAPTANAIVPAAASPTTSNAPASTLPLSTVQFPVRTNSLPMNTNAVTTNKPSAVATTPTTPTTPNMPVRAATINTSTPTYASPSLTTVDISKIHLPGGGDVHRPAVPVVIPATTSMHDWTRPKGQGDKIEYLFKDRHAFPPFRLAHGEMITRVPFHVKREDLGKLFKNTNTTLKDYQGEPPLSFFITAWYEGTLERKCDWPTGVRIELNGQHLPLQKREKVINPNGGPATITGKDRPFDLTRMLSQDKNMLTIHQPKCACSYLFAVQVYKRYSENYILNSVKNQVIDIETSERLIDNLLGKNQAENGDDDLVVLQKSIKLTLKCPLSFKKIKQPVRGVNCKHVDCFDLSTYLMVNKIENPTWVCPHCNKQVGPTGLARDLLVEKLLETLPKRVSEIEYTSDHANYTITKMEDPDTDDEDEDEDEGKDGVDGGNRTQVKYDQIVSKTANNGNVIDLISDDEDEDDQSTTTTATTNSNIPSKRSWEA